MAIEGGSGGGGSSAGDVRAGGAYYEVTGKDSLTRVLESLKSKVKAFGAAMGELKNSSFAGGFLGALGGVSAASVMEKAGEALGEWVLGMKELRKATESAGTEVEVLTARLDKALKRSAEWRGAFGMGTPGGRQQSLESLQNDLAFMERDAKNFINKALDADAEVARLKTSAGAAGRQVLSGPIEEETKKAKTFRDAFWNLKPRIDETREAIAKIKNPALDAQLIGDFNREMERLDDLVDDLGKSEFDNIVRRFEQRGLPKDRLAELKASAEVAKKAQNAFDMRESFATHSRAPWLTSAISIASDVMKQVQQIIGTMPVKGTFNASSALQQFGGGGLAGQMLTAEQRVAKATEATVKAVEKLDDRLRLQ